MSSESESDSQSSVSSCSIPNDLQAVRPFRFEPSDDDENADDVFNPQPPEQVSTLSFFSSSVVWFIFLLLLGYTHLPGYIFGLYLSICSLYEVKISLFACKS